MNITPEVILGIGGPIFGLAIAMGYSKKQTEDIWNQVDKLIAWREEAIKLMSALTAQIMVRDEQYKEILRRLTIIEDYMARQVRRSDE